MTKLKVINFSYGQRKQVIYSASDLKTKIPECALHSVLQTKQSKFMAKKHGIAFTFLVIFYGEQSR